MAGTTSKEHHKNSQEYAEHDANGSSKIAQNNTPEVVLFCTFRDIKTRRRRNVFFSLAVIISVTLEKDVSLLQLVVTGALHALRSLFETLVPYGDMVPSQRTRDSLCIL